MADLPRASSRARHRPSPRRPVLRRPSLRLRGALLVGAVVLLCATATTGPSGAAQAGQPVSVANTAHSWFLGGPGRGAFFDSTFLNLLRGFLHRIPRPGLPAPHPPSGGPTPTGAPTTTGTTTAAPPTTSTAPAPTSTPTTAPAGNPNTNCTLIVPPGALTAAGLATPYRFTATDPTAGPCHEANPDQSAFVEAAILDPATGAVSVYHPLVVDDGTQPAAAPVVPTLAPGAVVAIWFGFQADTLSLRHTHAHRGFMNLRGNFGGAGCVTGLPGSPFSQYSYCNAPRFFAAANAAIRAGKLAVPALGTGADGKPCPTTRDFSVVDQDQSDNLPTKYLTTPDGRIAQDNAANRAALTTATVLTNGSDNGLLDNHIDTALRCTPFTAPDLSDGGSRSSALALNELQAAADQGAPVALVPPNDPMTLDNGRTSVAKTNLYRAGVDMPPMNPATDTGLVYCTNLETNAPARLQLDHPFTAAAASPDPAEATLFDFLVQRLTESWSNLGCQDLTGRGAPVVGTAETTAATDTTAPTTTTPTTTTTTTPAPTTPVTPAPTTPTTTATPDPNAATSSTAPVADDTATDHGRKTTTTTTTTHR